MKLANRFKMKSFRAFYYCLGMGIEQDKEKRQLLLNQKQYILIMLKKFGMSDAFPVSKPVDVNAKLLQYGIRRKSRPNKFPIVDRKSFVYSILYSSRHLKCCISF